jgi:hypothetical protein
MANLAILHPALSSFGLTGHISTSPWVKRSHTTAAMGPRKPLHSFVLWLKPIPHVWNNPSNACSLPSQPPLVCLASSPTAQMHMQTHPCLTSPHLFALKMHTPTGTIRNMVSNLTVPWHFMRYRIWHFMGNLHQ